MHARLRILLTGAVQGTGFRPFVYRLARELGLTGFVRNTAGGVWIEVEGEHAALTEFRERLSAERPPASVILSREESWLEPACAAAFEIVESAGGGEIEAAVLPDLATCPECRAEIRNPAQRRCGYAFTNCTRCGPRFTIVLDLPYDRPRTVMERFALCPECRREYSDPDDRRFHAQPIACPACGPKLSMPIAEAAAALGRGAIVALKGIGGYQLLCDARDQQAVMRLRERKAREFKPLAVMLPSLEALRRYAEVSEDERRVLESAAAPIVLLRARAGAGLAESVTNGSPWLGAMLPYSPLHHLLMQQFDAPLVATSGNLSDEPIATTVEEAHERLARVADLFVDHDRPIARPCDDSVSRVALGRESLLRRARGYAPMPVPLGRTMRRGPRILAVGGHLKSSIALLFGSQVVLSQHIGDLDTPQSRACFERVVADLCRLYRFAPDALACDLHPDYWSTRWAHAQGKPVIAVQHHEAHAASCAAENDIDGPFLGVGWDGTGYGHDGTIWGGELFLFEDGLSADATVPRISRVASLRPFLLPGGEAAVKDTWRCAASLMIDSGLQVSGKLATVEPLITRRINCVETSSMGRLFDAVAAMTGVCVRNRYEGEAGLRLEAEAMRHGPAEPYPLPLSGLHADWRPMVREIDAELQRGVAAGVVSARFHETLAAWVVEVALGVGVRRVAVSGGCFQNAWLTGRCAQRLQAAGLSVLVHQRVPANDGGISLGQAVLAALQLARS
ncbi:MAG: carbamoyltransferase HypF [Bryobacteraceae bacterium]